MRGRGKSQDQVQGQAQDQAQGEMQGQDEAHGETQAQVQRRLGERVHGDMQAQVLRQMEERRHGDARVQVSTENSQAAGNTSSSARAEARRGVWIVQFIKFGMVGVLNTALDFYIYVLLIGLSFHFAAAQAISYMGGMLCSYILNNRFTFSSGTGSGLKATDRKKQLRFIGWNLTMLVLSIILLAVFGRVAGLDELWAKAATTVLVVAINFYGSRRWVFVKT